MQFNVKTVLLASLILLNIFFCSIMLYAADFQFQRVAKAAPDECYNGFGASYLDAAHCPEKGLPKRNHAYPWSLAKWKNSIWLGTGANIGWIYNTALYAIVFREPFTQETATYVVEGADSQYPGVPKTLRKFFGDWRPPQVWVYDIGTNTQTDITPADPLIDHTLGLRAAGICDGVVLLAGPTRFLLGLNLFAFDAETKAFLGSKHMPHYSSIRKFIVADTVLYTAVQDTHKGTGTVLRWTGTRQSPFHFTTVGKIDNLGANMVVHANRLFIGTWPPGPFTSAAGFISNNNTEAGIWMSPPIPQSGLTPSHVESWKKVWQVSDYEAEASIVASYGLGDLASFDGYLYWGTMHIPGNAYHYYFLRYYGEPDNATRAERNVTRATSIFRCSEFDNNRPAPHVELLYGRSQMPTYSPPSDNSPENWHMTDNNMGGSEPLFGLSGFDNIHNAYTWTMAVHNNTLFVGTYDKEDVFTINANGGDVWFFPETETAALALDTNGLGNQFNLGIRTMHSSEDGLFMGMVNVHNIHPEGGWELIKVTAANK